MLRDKLIFGALAGVVADLVMNIPELILWKLENLGHPLFHHAGSLLLPLEFVHENFLGAFLGFIAGKVYGAFLGIVFIALLVYTGDRYSRTKGLIYGAFLWLASYSGLASLPIVKLSAHPRTPVEVFLFLLLHLLFGFALGVIARWFDWRPKTQV
ncbi:MAG: hypothetical protein GX202_05400 [Firmicutes bacterium]|nr:hypothetical protein [Bacillota bacterium]